MLFFVRQRLAWLIILELRAPAEWAIRLRETDARHIHA
jgi:hypothetical protein